MSMADYVLDDGIVVVGEGRGWSIWHEPATNRIRFDVFAKGVHKTVPALSPEGIAPHFAQAARLKLWRDAFRHDQLIAPVRNLRRFCDARWPA